MFVIVPKGKPPTKHATERTEAQCSPPKGGEESIEAVDTSSKLSRTRTQSACDSCRIRKAKCSGGSPCVRCKNRSIVCVYSSHGKPVLPVNPGSVMLLEHQKTCLEATIKRMAVIIAKYESGVARDEASFDILELVEAYAPSEAKYHTTHTHPVKQGVKRGRDTTGEPASASKRRSIEFDTGEPPTSTVPTITERQLRSMQDTSALVPQQSWPDTKAGNEAMMQYLQMMSSARSQAVPSSLPVGDSHNPTDNLDQGIANLDSTSFRLDSIVDWNASLNIFSEWLADGGVRDNSNDDLAYLSDGFILDTV